ncbi:MAG: biotin/lipoyl-binding protein, partial [Planctomycetota bacterium]|nr:biotin/lipoyl-binding protein [Planctomycetota bacterium]
MALGILFGLIWMFRVPLGRLYDRLALPSVAIGRAARTSPLAAGAVAGTAANGYIVAARRAALSADIAGRIVEMTVEEGSVVKADQVVARLFAGEYRAALDQAVARMKATRRAIDRARAEFEEREAAVRTLEANVTAAKARIADAEANK